MTDDRLHDDRLQPVWVLVGGRQVPGVMRGWDRRDGTWWGRVVVEGADGPVESSVPQDRLAPVTATGPVPGVSTEFTSTGATYTVVPHPDSGLTPYVLRTHNDGSAVLEVPGADGAGRSFLAPEEFHARVTAAYAAFKAADEALSALTWPFVQARDAAP